MPSFVHELIRKDIMAIMIQGADIARIQEEYYLKTGEELSFKDAVAIYKKGL